MPEDQKIIYLTFDDGPTPEITHWTLDLLESYHAKATFFCIGNNIEKHPQTVQDILKSGHAVGNHSFDHPKGWQTNSAIYVEQVLKTQELINRQIENLNLQIPNSISKSPKLFRPPYGQIRPKQGKCLIDLGYKIIMWDVLPFDWKDSLSEEGCAQNVISNAGPGSIIVFHDSVKAAQLMKYALTKTLEHFSKKGYVFKSII
ncbi:peptidoglycan/xylan/chitin deacetylase (PgdA/CDA1 family) [Gelidibacter algens]|uniref:Peptidoglycan/xylan/chitin deacetylase (PgdA/CDA1 family) n=2 Tax=Gelidibacter algens TaxID=49280 RepID=A0A327S2S6_9FLAO|nr:peptidoglycan/xylan/chitin deacetylase (PgdA/CDA1 family) [Gelidibacter algens]